MILESNFNDLDYPDWLYREIVENCLPWQQGRKINFKEFNETYTLHDSYWIGIFFNIAYEQTATLAIQWDAVWLPNEIKQNTSVLTDWPYLFIQLSGIEQLNTKNYTDMVDTCRAIASCKFEEIEGKKFLVVDDVYGGQTNITYHGEETFLAVERNKCVLVI